MGVVDKKHRLGLLGCILAFVALSACGGSDRDRPYGRHAEREAVLSIGQVDLKPDEGGSLPAIQLPDVWANAFWPQMGGYPNHAMQHVALGAEIKTVWHRSIGRGATQRVPLLTQPIVIDGLVVTMDAEARIRAYALGNGELVWDQAAGLRRSDDAVLSGGIAYGGGYVYAATGYNELLALDLKTGDVVWRQALSGPVQSAPTVLDGRVYVITIDNRLVALDTKDGTQLWDYAVLDAGTGIVGGASPAANAKTVIAAFSSGEIAALRSENGALMWNDSLDALGRLGGVKAIADIRAVPVLDKGLLIAMNYSGQMIAIDMKRGERIWRRDIGGMNMPWVAGNMIFVVSADHQLIALSRQTGRVYWTKQLPRAYEGDNAPWYGPILAGGRLLTVSAYGRVLEIDPRTADVLNTWKVGSAVSAAPVVADGYFVILTDEGRVHVYR